MSVEDTIGIQIIENAAARLYAHLKQDKDLPVGWSFHAIEKSITLGDARTLEGQVLIRTPDGMLQVVDGEQLLLLHRCFPNFVKNWHLLD